MNQMEVLPLVSRHSRSALPSPLKSRWPTIDQVLGNPTKTPVDDMAAPFMSHNARSPLPSPQTMSLKPSPLKS